MLQILGFQSLRFGACRYGDLGAESISKKQPNKSMTNYNYRYYIIVVILFMLLMLLLAAAAAPTAAGCL